MLQEESLSIHEEMRGLSASDRHLFHIQSGSIHENKPKRLEKPNEMIALGTGLGIGLMSAMFCFVFPPILIGSCFIGLFVLLGLHNRYQRRVLNCREDYKEKRQEYMKEWTLLFLDSLKESSLRDCLDDWYFQDARNQVKSLCEDMLPKIINTDRKIMEHVISDQRRAQSVFTLCQPLQQKAEECRGRVLLFDLLYLSDNFIQQNKIHKGEMIGQGACANVYKAEISLNGKWIPVALKRFKYPLDNDTSYIQLMEMENLFNFDHPNVLKIYGASLLDVKDAKLLEIITELCQRTLMDIIDTTSCGRLNQGTEEFARAFELFMDINIQIAEGLEHIHSKKCVHRDLKLQNILMQQGRVKIADAGYLKHKELVTGSVVGSPTYMAPEVLSSKYSPSTIARDIYSFGIIMWEMWYQRRAFSESLYPEIESLNDMKNVLEKGDRPCLRDDLNALPLLKQLLESCWNDDPLKRPDVTCVKETLKTIRDQYINKVI